MEHTVVDPRTGRSVVSFFDKSLEPGATPKEDVEASQNLTEFIQGVLPRTATTRSLIPDYWDPTRTAEEVARQTTFGLSYQELCPPKG